MKRKEFATKLFSYMENRINEICEKFRTGNYNEASYFAFAIGSVSDIETFLKDKQLIVIKKDYGKSR